METRLLGTSGITASRLGLGCVTFGREVDESVAFEVMDYAFEHGIRLFDTAEAYGGGEAQAYRRDVYGIDDKREVSEELHSSEKIVGRWLLSRGVRDQLVLVTKVSTNFTQAHLFDALSQSLSRLQTDHVDVYLLHSFDSGTSIEESVRALDGIMHQKMSRTVGFSNYTLTQTQSFLNATDVMHLSKPEVLQLPYNLLERGIESDILPLCCSRQIAVLGYSPLAAGFLTGKYSSNSTSIAPGSRFHVIPGHVDYYFKEPNFLAVERLLLLSRRVGIPPQRLALAWALHRHDIGTVLIGARTIDHLRNGLAALAMRLEPELLHQLDLTSPQ